MKTRRRFVLRATTSAVAFVAFAVPATFANATTPPTEPVPTTTPPTDDEVVYEESWALAPGGSLDPELAGNRAELSYVADPGVVIDDEVTLYNFGTEQLTFRVYATDAFNDDQGQFELPPGDQAPTNVGSWVKLAQELITVPAGQQATIPITITVPADAAPGDHVGAILASSPTLGTGEQGEILTLDRRTGTRLYVRVSGPLFPELAVADVDTTYNQALNPLSGSAHVSFRVENRGNVRLSGTATVSIAGPFGIGERKVTLPEIPELLPGEAITLTADVDDLIAGLFDFTTVRVEPRGLAGDGAVESSTGEATTFAPPVSALLLLLSLILALLARRYRRHRLAEEGQAP